VQVGAAAAYRSTLGRPLPAGVGADSGETDTQGTAHRRAKGRPAPDYVLVIRSSRLEGTRSGTQAHIPGRPACGAAAVLADLSDEAPHESRKRAKEFSYILKFLQKAPIRT
jgi:hypothetical protein